MGLASRPTRTQRGLFLLEGAFERPVTKNSELAEVVFTAADFVPDSSESKRAKYCRSAPKCPAGSTQKTRTPGIPTEQPGRFFLIL